LEEGSRPIVSGAVPIRWALPPGIVTSRAAPSAAERAVSPEELRANSAGIVP
jgi:hypothetical protein